MQNVVSFDKKQTFHGHYPQKWIHSDAFRDENLHYKAFCLNIQAKNNI